ncbi:FecR domain-containing protein [Oceanispirochaeta sp.]|jgi:hypothetical protein|uniref:FecR domain-containing protein n=1 Tax=Oceanispirochaeta sp. TaxID=2035350 RepID=UPI002623E6D8|nr:FecR domain-containing protein [Oceanispirochaeta sp.]MDA3958436.1 FecR domain-containing protein [Oceanispirochaeta sp.]
MKSLVKSLLLIMAGLLLAVGLLYGYSIFFKTAGNEGLEESLRFIPIEPGDAIISRISGDVFIIREELILTPHVGDALREGDVIKVVDESWCQVHFVGKATMSLRSNTLVKIQKLLSSPMDSDIRTELLTGSMIYKVDRLDATDNLEVIAQEKIYRVEGTEFMVEIYSGGSRVAVQEGNVVVLQKSGNQEEKLLKTVPSGFSLDLQGWNKDLPLPEAKELNQEDKRIFEEEGPGLPYRDPATMMYLEIRTAPPGGQIFVDGKLTGQSRLSGLFPAEGNLTILARKRGFSDSSMNVKLQDLKSSLLVLKMNPLGLNESLEAEKTSSRPEKIDEIKSQFEKEISDLNSGFSRKIEENTQENKKLLQDSTNFSMSLQSDIVNLRNKNSALEKKKTEQEKMRIELEKELENSLSEQQKLRDLLTQIQELSDQ